MTYYDSGDCGEFVHAVARTMWALDWADWAEVSGCEIFSIMPPTPDDYRIEALVWVGRFEAAAHMSLPCILAAVERDNPENVPSAPELGYLAIMEGLGHGVRLGDDGHYRPNDWMPPMVETFGGGMCDTFLDLCADPEGETLALGARLAGDVFGVVQALLRGVTHPGAKYIPHLAEAGHAGFELLSKLRSMDDDCGMIK